MVRGRKGLTLDPALDADETFGEQKREDDLSLNGKVALVIGASRGMGKQLALDLAQEGADVIVAARTERPDQSTVSGVCSAGI